MLVTTLILHEEQAGQLRSVLPRVRTAFAPGSHHLWLQGCPRRHTSMCELSGGFLQVSHTMARGHCLHLEGVAIKVHLWAAVRPVQNGLPQLWLQREV